MQIGNRLRELRKAKNMTLSELSKRSGVALATLSRMENNKMPGTVEAHTKICGSLETSLGDLYLEIEDSSKTIDNIPRNKRPEHFMRSKKATCELLVSKTHGKKIMPLMLKLEVGGETPKEKHKFGIEKFIYVIEGKIEITVGKENYSLSCGDSLYIDASLPHIFRNTSKTTAKAICIVSPPS